MPVYLYLGLIFYLSHQPASILPHFKFDKLVHFSEYALLGLLLMRALAKSYRQSNHLLLRFIALFIAVTYAGTDEFHQRYILGRSSDFLDWLVDSFGAALSSFLFRRSDKP
ncbi:MAG: hypothetical protein A3G37_02655 [Omnitrophica WOR_2 bacterium RIFCSPLOWO2_12_FULL_46_30]|nr:MAG: hypothetical protein A3D27_02615 [Omnitrophica WOR_2 bacterium RIFCSPHIGHO2_02_FULL_46_37]OGX51317.1 MAG: hypothetical protein A3G37_02655 [Omnitrophica WOR_2 bacterium RIFCSPLOWO2_12_FULL_46_30]